MRGQKSTAAFQQAGGQEFRRNLRIRNTPPLKIFRGKPYHILPGRRRTVLRIHVFPISMNVQKSQSRSHIPASPPNSIRKRVCLRILAASRLVRPNAFTPPLLR
jgi:hypothetical protein